MAGGSLLQSIGTLEKMIGIQAKSTNGVNPFAQFRRSI
jgi:hypothetical protein